MVLNIQLLVNFFTMFSFTQKEITYIICHISGSDFCRRRSSFVDDVAERIPPLVFLKFLLDNNFETTDIDRLFTNIYSLPEEGIDVYSFLFNRKDGKDVFPFHFYCNIRDDKLEEMISFLSSISGERLRLTLYTLYIVIRINASRIVYGIEKEQKNSEETFVSDKSLERVFVAEEIKKSLLEFGVSYAEHEKIFIREEEYRSKYPSRGRRRR